MLASAKIDRFCFCGLKLDGREFASLVASVAERLVGALAARTPEVTIASFNRNGIRALLGNNGV
jgi:hypothetical protein